MKEKRKIIKFSILIVLILVIFAGVLIGAFSREGAVLYLEPKNIETKEMDSFEVKVMVDTKENVINSARGIIVFEKDKLEVLEIKKENSIFKFWDNTTSFSNYEGKIVFGGGLPSPGFTGKGLILEIVFRAKKVDKGNINFKDGAVLANDNKGTDILSKMEGASFSVKKEELPLPQKEKTKEKKALEPPIITTYPKEINSNEIFYAEGIAPAKMKVIFYIGGENIEEIIREVDVDSKGSWFYSHNKFLAPGEYYIFAKTKNPLTGEISMPSAKQQLIVQKEGIMILGQYINKEVIFGMLILVLFVAVILLLFYFFYDLQRCAKERFRLMKEIKEANDSVIDGFGVLKTELSRELEFLRKLHITEDVDLSPQEREKRQRLINDLLEDLELIEKIQNYIRKEVKDIEDNLPPIR
jgi:hypothetical protein